MADRTHREERILAVLREGRARSDFDLAERLQTDIETLDVALTNLQADGLIKFTLETVPLDGHTRYERWRFWSLIDPRG